MKRPRDESDQSGGEGASVQGEYDAASVRSVEFDIASVRSVEFDVSSVRSVEFDASSVGGVEDAASVRSVEFDAASVRSDTATVASSHGPEEVFHDKSLTVGDSDHSDVEPRQDDGDADDGEERDRKKKKKKKEEKKKHKKKHKKHKRRRRDSDDSDDGGRGGRGYIESETSPYSSKCGPSEPMHLSHRTNSSANDFFASLRAQEAIKPGVGTVHATGKVAGLATSGQGVAAGLRTSTQRATGMFGGAIPHDQNQDGTGQWECHRCKTMNGRSFEQCKNCRSMKRMNSYI